MLTTFASYIAPQADEEFITSPLERWLGQGFELENISVVQTGDRVTITAEELPNDILGVKTQITVDLTPGTTVADVSYNTNSGEIQLFVDLPFKETEGTKIPVRNQ